MLSKKVFIFKMEELLMSFPNWKIDNDDPRTMSFWYNNFSNLSDDSFVHMVDQYISNENFNPTIGGLKRYDTLPIKSATQIKHEQMLKGNGLL